MPMNMKTTTTPKAIMSIKLQEQIHTHTCARIIKLALRITTKLQQSKNKAYNIGQHWFVKTNENCKTLQKQ
jgi:hypothetical protein